jgi:signal transduction histidine kinase/ligand-binding sensor domain-containing protein
MKGFLTSLSLLCFAFCFGQSIRQVEGVPTNEIYDLHVDSKGFLWVAHDLGITRYDGIHFTHYSIPQQASLAMTDLCEDRQGRLWFHNFSGQVFYIENGQMHLFAPYNFQEEAMYPRMAVCGEEVIITSSRGIMVCNTSTMTARFLHVSVPAYQNYVSLSVAGNKVVLYFNEHNRLYLYDREQGIRLLGLGEEVSFPPSNSISLQPRSFNDTIFSISNPAGLVQKLVLRENRIVKAGELRLPDFINAVTVAGSFYSITTKGRSLFSNGKQLDKENITDVVVDREGNTWYASLREGLLFEPRATSWKQISHPLKKANDFVRSIQSGGRFLVMGTQKGDLYAFDNETGATWHSELPSSSGGIEYISPFSGGQLVVATAAMTYVADPVNRRLWTMPIAKTVKDIVYSNQSLNIATANSLIIQPNPEQVKDTATWVYNTRLLYPYLRKAVFEGVPFFYHNLRAKSLRFDSNFNRLVVVFKNGLFEVGQEGLTPFLYKGEAVYASSVAFRKGKLFVATLSNGILVRDRKGVRRIPYEQLATSSVIRIKAETRYLWLFKTNGIQVLDPRTEQLVFSLELPHFGSAEVYDVTEDGGTAYLTTAHGLYAVSLDRQPGGAELPNYLDHAMINGRLRLPPGALSLPYDQNDVEFHFSSPVFFNPGEVIFRYRLLGSRNEAWQTTRSLERSIRFASLMPGTYRFEAYAENAATRAKGRLIAVPLTILRPWWNQWWFFGLLALVLAGLLYALYRFRLRQLFKMERMRRAISSDLHDDIGATLSSIRIYTQLAREDRQNDVYLNFIQNNVKEVVDKLDDLVWSINPRNDTWEQLTARMEQFATALFTAQGIRFTITIDEHLPTQPLSITLKRNFYLVFKELVNNVVKHSQCTECHVRLHYHQGTLQLQVKDNGIGLDPHAQTGRRNGIRNMHERTAEMKGTLHIDSGKGGTTSTVLIPIA